LTYLHQTGQLEQALNVTYEELKKAVTALVIIKIADTTISHQILALEPDYPAEHMVSARSAGTA
jgi:hypothetical protein